MKYPSKHEYCYFWERGQKQRRWISECMQVCNCITELYISWLTLCSTSLHLQCTPHPSHTVKLWTKKKKCQRNQINLLYVWTTNEIQEKSEAKIKKWHCNISRWSSWSWKASDRENFLATMGSDMNMLNVPAYLHIPKSYFH